MKCFCCKKLIKNPLVDVCGSCLEDGDESEHDYDEHLQKEIEDIVNIRGVTPCRYIE